MNIPNYPYLLAVTGNVDNNGTFCADGWMAGGGGLTGLIIMFLFWLILLAVAAYIIGKLFWRPEEKSEEKRAANAALDILRERYARGEIDKEEFDRRKQDLS